MGWSNPAISWGELEKRLSGRMVTPQDPEAPISRRKHKHQRIDVERPGGPVTPYAELHCHSSFSFLDGASGPDHLVLEALRLGLHALAITDHDGFYGAPLFAETAQLHGGLGTVYGAELSLGLTKPQNGVADPEGSHLLVLARGVEGYHRLAGAITDAQLRGDEKGRPVYDLRELAERGRGHWLVLTGCRKGMVRQALARGPAYAAEELDRLTALFGHEHVAVELVDHGFPTDSAHNDLLARLAVDHGLPYVATNNVHYARPELHRVADAMAAVRARRSLAEMDGWLPASGLASLRSGEEMARRFARYPGAVARSVEIADAVAFDLQKASPRLPKFVPDGWTPAGWLRELTERGFAQRYAGTPLERAARERVEHELRVIAEKDFDGYFVIVHDIVEFARSRGILCQGRGSAASSAVCYALGITAVDPVFYRLPFERFISQHREEEPDIDVDFDSDRREEVIQWVYEKYGRHNAAQVANVVGYRPKMAVRDAAKALGHSPGQQDAWSKQVTSWTEVAVREGGEHDVPASVVELANGFLGAPRHLGIHSGGMVLTERPIGEVVPIERARMDRRTVLQWDKDGCEFMGLVKFDLLGLGMLSALDHMMSIVATHLGEHWTLATIPKEEPAVYDMLCRADSVGVFQVESRAQIGTLPRLQPREFYDLAIEIALIRPGPIQGGAVHPYVRRATGREPIEYAHPLLIPVLERTRGVPLFQEQLMEMARVLGDCNRDEADLLRRAMGSKRGVERIESVKEKLMSGMAAKGISGARADAIYLQILSFANFGFAESHALSFAKLVYASSWCKLHYPGAFLAALLRAQPMGFYSPQSLLHDARRHGVEVLRPDLARSQRPRTSSWWVAGRSDGARRVPARRRAHRVGPRYARPDAGAPARHGVRRPPRAGLGARHQHRGGDADRGGAGGAAVRRPGRPVPAGRARRAPARGAGDGRCVRHRVRRRRAVAAPGAVERGLDRERGAPRGHPGRRTGADAAGHGRRRAHHGGPVGDRDDARRAPVRAPAGAAARGRDQVGGGLLRVRAGPPGARRRAGHPPAAARHGRRRHLPQPRGRDRDAQRGLHRRGLAALPRGREQRRRHGDPRHPRARGRRHQPGRRPPRRDRDRPRRGRPRPPRPPPLPRLPLNAESA